MSGLTVLGLLACLCAAGASAEPDTVLGKRILSRSDSAWMSQQIEEPCILPNPKVPGRLIMFYGAVPASNRKIGRASCRERVFITV